MEKVIKPITVTRGQRITVTRAPVQRNPHGVYVRIADNHNGFIPLEHLAGKTLAEKIARRNALQMGDHLEVVVRCAGMIAPGEPGSGSRVRPFARIILSEEMAQKNAIKDAFEALKEGKVYEGKIKGPAIKHNQGGEDFVYGYVITLSNGVEGVVPFKRSQGRHSIGTTLPVVVTRKKLLRGARRCLQLAVKSAAP